MHSCRTRIFSFLLICVVLCRAGYSLAAPVQVRYLEGLTLGFLLLRDLDGNVIAYGELNQAVNGKNGVVTDDLQFRFTDGSSYHEITQFTQRHFFRLLSDRVTQNGPSFMQNSETSIEMSSGTVSVRTVEKGKQKITAKHFDLPSDLANGLLFTLVKNLKPTAPETTVSFLAAGTSPRIVKMSIHPEEQKSVSYGGIVHKTQHYVVRIKIGGVAGALAPLVGKQPPDVHIWIIEGPTPSFLQSEGPLSADTPVLRVELKGPPNRIPPEPK